MWCCVVLFQGGGDDSGSDGNGGDDGDAEITGRVVVMGGDANGTFRVG